MPDWNKKKDLGDTGENIALNLLRKQGINVYMSSDDFDSKGDFFLEDGSRIEIKTQPPFYTKDWLTTRETQLKKLLKAKAIYWVTTPLVERPTYTHSGKIFETLNPSKLHYFKAGRYNDGGARIAFPIIQDEIRLIHKIVDKKDLENLAKFRSRERNV